MMTLSQGERRQIKIFTNQDEIKANTLCLLAVICTGALLPGEFHSFEKACEISLERKDFHELLMDFS